MNAAAVLATEALLIAQGAGGLVTSIGTWAIILVVIAGIVGIALIIIRAAGLAIPSWVVQVLWVVLAVCVGVVAIKFILSIL